MIEAGFALLCCGLALALAVASLRARTQLRELRKRLFHAEVILSEAMRLQRIERHLAETQRLTETVVSGGAQTVRAIHRGIAAIPFGILEAIPVTRDTTRLVRYSHDRIADAVYGGIEAVNRGVGKGLRAGLAMGAPTPPAVENPDPPAIGRPPKDG